MEEPTPVAASGGKGTGTVDPALKKEELPQVTPPEDFQTITDLVRETSHAPFIDPALPIAPGGDGRHGTGSGDGEGVEPGVGIKGMGPGGLKVRLGDMNILRREQPVYPTSEMANGVEDMVELEVTIDEHGIPIVVTVKKASVPSLAAEAQRAIRLWRFAAVMNRGVAVRATFRLDVEFMISNKAARPKRAS